MKDEAEDMQPLKPKRIRNPFTDMAPYIEEAVLRQEKEEAADQEANLPPKQSPAVADSTANDDEH
jgi:hypothetical protein